MSFLLLSEKNMTTYQPWLKPAEYEACLAIPTLHSSLQQAEETPMLSPCGQTLPSQLLCFAM